MSNKCKISDFFTVTNFDLSTCKKLDQNYLLPSGGTTKASMINTYVLFYPILPSNVYDPPGSSLAGVCELDAETRLPTVAGLRKGRLLLVDWILLLHIPCDKKYSNWLTKIN